MEKLAAHLTKIGTEADEWDAVITKSSAIALAEQSRSVAIEFAEWVELNEMEQDYLADHTHTKPELFDLFLSQKQF